MISVILLVIIYFSFISLGLQDSLLGSGWPSMYGGLNVPLHYAGYISMIIASGTVVSSIFSAKVIKKLGTGVVAAVSVSLTAAALFGFSLSAAFWQLCLCAIPLGLGSGSIDAALNNYVALHYKARQMNWLHCFWGIGVSTGPYIMAFFLINKNSWNMGYRTVSVIQFCLVVILIFAVSLWRKNKSDNGGEKIENSQNFQFKDLLNTAGVKQVLIAFFFYCSMESVIVLWGSSFLVTVKNIPLEIAAWWISLFFMGITFGRFVSGFLTIKLNNRKMIRLGQTLIACGIILLILPTGKLLLLPGLFIIGLGHAPIYPSLIHETPRNFGADKSQAIIGMQMASAYVGTTFMPPLFGKIASNINFGIFPLFIGCILILNIIMVEMLNKKVDKSRV